MAFMNHLTAAMENDQEPKHKIGEDLLRMYDNATPLEKEAIDKTFAFLCGHTFETLVIHAEQGKRAPLVRKETIGGLAT